MHRTNHTKKPDADNLEKFLNDALKGVIWRDDAQLSWVLRSKTQSSDNVGKTEFCFVELGDKIDYEDILKHIKQNIEIED